MKLRETSALLMKRTNLTVSSRDSIFLGISALAFRDHMSLMIQEDGKDGNMMLWEQPANWQLGYFEC